MKLIAILSILMSFTFTQVSYAAGVIPVGEELVMQTVPVWQKAGFATVLQLISKKSGRVLQQVVALPTPKSTLKNYRPSVISKTLNGLKRGSANSGALVARVMNQKLLRFPVESAGFFAALGAVMTYELVFNYAQNPVAYQQLVESQMDPVGQLAFYFFMVGNGVSAEPLMNMVQQGKLPRRLAPFIPFFGMSVGSVASNVVHELGHAPNMWACARGLVTGKGLQSKACDQAADTWNQRGGAAGIANEWAPSLLSLVGSTIASGLVQKGTEGFGRMVMAQAIRKGVVEVSLKVVGDVTTRQVIRIGAIEVATLFVPGGMLVKGYKVVSFVTQLAVFSWIDEVMRRPINFAYQNLTRGKSLQSMNRDLNTYQTQLRANKYYNTTNAMSDALVHFGKAMTEWRQVNLSDVLEAQGNWEQALADLSNSYKSAELFYANFIGHIQAKKFGRYKDAYADGSEVRVIDQIYPLNGVTPSGPLANPLPQMLMDTPDVVEAAQLQTIDNVVAAFRSGSFYHGKNLPPLTAADKAKLNKLLDGLAQTNVREIGVTLIKINNEAAVKMSPSANARGLAECPRCYDLPLTALQKHVIALKKALGNPNPMMIPGIAYAQIYQKFPEYADIIQKTKYPKTYGGLKDVYRVSTETMAESMIASMIVGPDAERESLVYKRSGYAAIFKAPKVTKDLGLDFMIPASALQGQGMFGRGTTGLSVFGADIGKIGGGKVYGDSAFSYLTNGGIRSNILNDNSQSFANWWARYVETRYVNAWTLFESQYQENIAKLVLRLRAQKSAWNRSETPNAVLASLEFENYHYVNILKEMSIALATSQNSHLRMQEDKALNTSYVGQLRSTLTAWKPWNFSFYKPSILTVKPQPAPKAILPSPGTMFAKPNAALMAKIAWHGKLSTSLTKLQNLLLQIRAAHHVKKSNPNQVLPLSVLTLPAIQSASAEAQAALNDAKQFFLAPQGMGLILTNPNRRLLDTCLKGLKKNIAEVANYAMIANAVSYRVRQGNTEFVNPRCENMMRQQKSLGVEFIQKVAGCE